MGQGKFVPRLSFHRRTKLDTDWEDYLRTTWAPMEKAERDRVEAFLAEYLRPEQGDVWPRVPGIPVNLPGIYTIYAMVTDNNCVSEEHPK